MAETIGRAFIKILADGSGFGRDLERQLDAEKPMVERSASKMSKAFDEAYQEQSAKNKTIEKAISKNVDQAFGKIKADAEKIGGEWGTRLGKSIDRGIREQFPHLERQSKDLSSRISAAILSDFARTGQFSLNLRRRISDALGDMHSEALEMNAEFNAEWARQNEENEQQYKLHNQRLAKIAQDRTDAEAEWRAEFNKTGQVIRKTLGATARDLRAFGNANQQVWDTIHDSHQSMAVQWVRDHDTIVREMERTGRASAGFSGDMNHLSASVARAFGKGARNDLVNFFGSLVGGMTRVIGKVPGVARLATALTSTFGRAGPIIVGAGMTTVALSGVVTALSLASGAVTALAGSISYGLVGALAPLAGLIAPVGIAVSALAIAFIGMDEATKAFVGRTLDPLQEGLYRLGDAARPGILDGIVEGSGQMRTALTGMQQLFRNVGVEIGRLIERAAGFTATQPFTDFIDQMESTAPRVLGKLGTIFGNITEGMMDAFVVLGREGGPVDGFLDKIIQITDAWADLSTAEGGKLDTFFTNAAESASALWHVLTGIGDVFGVLASAGREAGDSMMNGIGNALHDFADWLREHEGSLQDWFSDAERFGSAIGNLFVSITNLVSALDTQAMRDFVIMFTGGLADAINLVARALNAVLGPLNAIGGKFDSVALAAAGLALAGPRIVTAMSGIGSAMGRAGRGATGFVQGLRTAEGRMGALRAAAAPAAAALGVGLITATQNASTELRQFGTVAGAALTGFAVGGPWGAAIGGAVGLFAALGQGASESSARVDELTAAFISSKGAIDDTVRSLATMALEESGALKDAEALGLDLDLVTDAALGNEEALAAVNAQLDNYGQVIQAAGGSKGSFAAGYDADADAARRLDEAINGTNEEVDEAIGAAQRHSAAMGESTTETNQFATAAEQAARAARQLSTGLQQLAGWLDKREALRNYKTSIQDLSKALRDGFQPKDVETIDQVGRNFIQVAESLSKQPAKQETFIDGAIKSLRTIAREAGPKAREAIQPLIQRLTRLGKIDAKPKLGADSRELTRKVRRGHLEMDNLGRQQVRPKIDADTAPGGRKIKNFQELMRKIPGLQGKVDAIIGAETKDADGKVKNTKKEVDKVAKPHTVKLEADATDAMGGINSVQTALNNLPNSKTINIHTNYTSSGQKPKAAGGILYGPTPVLAGEAGPEAIVPLARPLAMVDPAVRELSAIAQGLRYAPTRPAQDTGTGTRIDVGGITVISPQADPRAVAAETMNRLVAVGY